VKPRLRLILSSRDLALRFLNCGFTARARGHPATRSSEGIEVMSQNSKLRALCARATTFAAFAAAASVAQAQTRVQILHASDLEGGVAAIGDAPRFAAVVQGLENDAAAANVPSLLLSAGDNYIPGPFFSAAGDASIRTPLRNALGLAQVREREGRVDVAILNILGLDASALGNHEFDPGTSALREIVGPDIRDSNGDGVLDDARWFGVDFPYLSANLDFSADPSLASLFEPSLALSTSFKGSPADLAAAAAAKKLATATIVERNGERFGIVGATTPLLATISSPGLTTVKNPGAGTNNMAQLATILQPVIDALLAQGVDKIVLVTHLQQIALEQQLVPLLRGVDVAIAGGSDTLLADGNDVLRPGDVAQGPYPIVASNADGDPALIVSTDGQYSYVGRLVVDFDAAGRVLPVSVDPAVSGAYAADDNGVAAVWGNLVDPFLPGTKGARVQTLTVAVQAVVTAKDGNVVGNSDVFLEGRRSFVRTQETNLGNLSADANLFLAQQSDASVLVSLKNGGGIRDFIGAIDGSSGALHPTQANPLSGKQATEVSQLDIENTLRFNNGLSLVTVSASELLVILEHALAASGPGATPGQFPQVGGLAFSFDLTQPAGSRLRSAAIKGWDGATLDVLAQNGAALGDPSRPIRMVTLNFLASGGDGYPFPALAEDRVDLLLPGAGTGAANFASDGSEQDALAEFFLAAHPDSSSAYAAGELPPAQDGRIQDLAARSDSAAFPPVAPAGAPKLEFVGRYDSGLGAGAAEIPAYDAISRRMFVVNAEAASVDIVDLANPAQPSFVSAIDIDALFSTATEEASPNSVAVANGLVAVAVQLSAAGGAQRPGVLAFFDSNGVLIEQAVAGALPDMVTFSPNGLWALTANEGEPNGDYSVDPEGSVTIVNTLRVRLQLALPALAHLFPLRPNDTRQVGFAGLNGQKAALQAAGVRIYGPNATVAQDLEPESIAVDANSQLAYVTLQENNAIAVIAIRAGSLLRVAPIGFKDWSLSALDASDRDFAIRIQPWPVFGMPQPDSIAAFDLGGATYLVVANEGDARDYTGFAEEARVSSLALDPGAFPNAAALKVNAALGRLTVTNQLGDSDGDGDFDALYTLGGRSLSILQAHGNGTVSTVYDSGDELEQITAALDPANFNGFPFDTRSDNKGPEPEGLALGRIGARTYAFVGLERIGGVMMYDVTVPTAAQFVQYVNTRSVVNGAAVGDLAPEGLVFVPASSSPSGAALLIVAFEVSGTVAIFEVR
jgi:2',3'-cyclic-nucleotide 2'-phosphodiesterase/3'-nucleotidase/5'-nucleotidase